MALTQDRNIIVTWIKIKIIRRVSHCIAFASPLFLVAACTANIPAATPFSAALASCSTHADAKHMQPEILRHPPSEWRYPISAVKVIGPEQSSIPPPILAVTFGQALENSLRQTGALESSTGKQDKDYRLLAKLISQNRRGTFATTSLDLTVEYSLVLNNKSEQVLWKTSITTTGEIKDWKTDACKRLRKLQEDLAKQNIRRLIDELPIKQ